MATEHDIALGVMKIAAMQPSSICTFKRAYLEIPMHVRLTADNTEPSIKRPGEPMWYQIVRNIKSHDGAEGNFIRDGLLEHVPKVGYRITRTGLSYINGL
jgi:hypothetical protein